MKSTIRNPQSAMGVGLDAIPGSISAAQRSVLFAQAATRGMTHDDLREAAGKGIRELSRAEASELITRIGGQPLAHAPGRAPRARKRGGAGTTRMITEQQVEQIARLGFEAFKRPEDRSADISVWGDRFFAWLKKNFKVKGVRDLATAARAGEVIRVLKLMVARQSRDRKGAVSC